MKEKSQQKQGITIFLIVSTMLREKWLNAVLAAPLFGKKQQDAKKNISTDMVAAKTEKNI